MRAALFLFAFCATVALAQNSFQSTSEAVKLGSHWYQINCQGGDVTVHKLSGELGSHDTFKVVWSAPSIYNSVRVIGQRVEGVLHIDLVAVTDHTETLIELKAETEDLLGSWGAKVISTKTVNGSDPIIDMLGRSTVVGTTRLFDWSGVQIRMNVSNTPFLDVLLETGGYYQIIINGRSVQALPFNQTVAYTRIVSNLDPSKYNTVELYKRNEPSVPRVQISVLHTVRVASSAVFAPFRGSDRRVEFVGDSITCGYGVVGVPPCDGFGSNGILESAYDNYVQMTADRFKADVARVAWSGRGMVRNCCGYPGTLMPVMFKRTLANSENSTYNYQWKPQAVVINLGTNDAHGQPVPSLLEFYNGYAAFMKTVYAVYGRQTKIFTICGGMVEGPFCDTVAKVSKDLGGYHVAVPRLTQPQFGCNGHPNVAGNRVMADLLAKVMSPVMGW